MIYCLLRILLLLIDYIYRDWLIAWLIDWLIDIDIYLHFRYNLTALAASLLYQINFIVGYGLMLIAMIQSVILFTAISLGAGVGYFIAQPAYGLISDHAGNDIYYVKQTEVEKLDELETERLDTSLCPPHQFTYV